MTVVFIDTFDSQVVGDWVVHVRIDVWVLFTRVHRFSVPVPQAPPTSVTGVYSVGTPSSSLLTDFGTPYQHLTL